MSLQTKILGLIISLLLFVIVLLTGIFAFVETKQTENQMGQLALQVAKTVSFMPSIKKAFELENPSQVIQPIAEQIREEVGAEFVVVGNNDSIRYSHPHIWKIGKKMVGGDNDLALLEGKYYTSKAVGTLGPSLRGKAPIFDDDGEIIGIVSVGFLIEDVRSAILKNLIKISFFSLFVLVLGVIGGVLLVRNIRKDTLGLEPHEIASLYRERNAILLSIREGIIAIDEKGIITMMNHSAREMLDLSEDCMNQLIDQVFPNTKMYRVLQSGVQEKDQEMVLRDRTVIVNRTPIIENNRVVGGVASFRDKTEVKEMINTLSEVRKYSEDLRAQTHEYTNKLYVLSGLLQLGHYEQAIQMIQSESTIHQHQNKILFDQIHDRTVQAILLGKISKASEKKISFTIDPDTFLHPLPVHIDISKLITILGNIIDNAFEAVNENKKKEVTFFATDMGNDIVFEVGDNGFGIDSDTTEEIFEKGYSTKMEKNRGYGLSNVKEIVDELHGTIEVQNQKKGGAIFSIFIPKT